MASDPRKLAPVVPEHERNHIRATLSAGQKFNSLLELPAANVMLRLPSFTAAAVVTSQTDGVTTLPMKLARIMAEQLELVTFKPPVPFPPIEIAQYWHERFHRDAGHKWLRVLSFELFASSSR